MRMGVFGLVLALGLGASAAMAQAPAPSHDVTSSKVDPERLAAAREVIKNAQGDRKAVLSAMRVPMVGMVQQMGLKEPEKAKVLVDEVIMPILESHFDELLSMQALSFAAVLPTEDLKAIAAFYETPAGRNLVKAQPLLAQAQLTGLQQWLGTLRGEMQDKIAAAQQSHGWGPGNAKP